MNAETEMAGADGLGASSPNYAERLRRLRELIDDESPSDGIHNPEVAELFDAADPDRECICVEQDTPGHAAGCPMAEPLPECPQFLACTSEGSGESSYRDNPDFYAGTRDEVGEWAAGSFNEGWALNWIVDLDTGQAVNWSTSVLLGDLSARKVLEVIASGVPREDEWDSAADFMEAVAEGLDRAGITRPDHYPEED